MNSLTIYVSDDVHVDSGNPASNYETSPAMQVGLISGAYTRRGLLRFDLSLITELPAYADITSAILYLKTGIIFYSSETSIGISLYRVTGSWTANAVTWNTQPAINTTAYGTKSVADKSTPTYEAFDIETLLTALIANSGDSISIRETVEGTIDGILYIYSEDSGSSYRPYMVVEYETPVPTDPVLDSIDTITEDENEFTWDDSTCDKFDSSELYYEMQISLDGGSNYGSTLTSTEGDPAYTVDFRDYLGLGATQYYYNANVKIRVRAKTPEYDSVVYYSEWVESDDFIIAYASPPPTPVYSDETNIIDAYWKTPQTDMGYPNAEKTLTDIYFNAWGTDREGAAGGQVKITTYFNRNGYWKSKTKTVTLSTTRRPHHLMVNMLGRLFYFKIENVSGSAINISGFEGVFELDED